MATDSQDLSGFAGADAAASSDGPELEELAHAITGDDPQGAAPTAPPPPAAALATVGPPGPVPPPPSDLVGSSASRTVGETPTVVATPASEAVMHARAHARGDTPAGPRTVARPIFRRPRTGTTHTSGETPAAGDTSAMETRMNTEEPASHVSLRRLARKARSEALQAAVGERRTPGRPTPQRPAAPAARPERSSRARPGHGRSLERFMRRDK